MMNFESCEINNIVIHDIGNKYEDGKLRLSESCFLPDDMDAVSYTHLSLISQMRISYRRQV